MVDIGDDEPPKEEVQVSLEQLNSADNEMLRDFDSLVEKICEPSPFDYEPLNPPTRRN